MKYSDIFAKYLGCEDADQTFKYLIDNLIDTITGFDYFVNWEKVYENASNLEMDLNLLNYLVGSKDITLRLEELLKQYPSIVRTFPVLLAIRNDEIKILTGSSQNDHIVRTYSFRKRYKLTQNEIKDLVSFCNETGLIDLLQNHINSNLVDYVIGVEVGLDTNARKNRHGDDMEKLVGKILQRICDKNGYKFMEQATAGRLLHEWGSKINVDKNDRRFDFAVHTNDSLYLFETNYYGGRGSKLKATAGEYISLFDLINNQGIKFIWITDGLGWESTQNPLREAFNHYILNLKMIRSGLLSEILELDL